MGEHMNCLDMSQYGTLLIVDPEEEFFAEEVEFSVFADEIYLYVRLTKYSDSGEEWMEIELSNCIWFTWLNLLNWFSWPSLG